jgi:hypothetical protein
LEPQSNPDGKKVLDLIMDEMENKREHLVVIFAGYKKLIEKLLESNPVNSHYNNFKIIKIDFGSDL